MQSIRSWFVRLVCRHRWINNCYNLAVYDHGNDTTLITIGFRYCPKCAKSKLDFIFGNE